MKDSMAVTYPGAKNRTKCGLLVSSLSNDADLRVTTWVLLSNATPFCTIVTSTNNAQARCLKYISMFNCGRSEIKMC